MTDTSAARPITMPIGSPGLATFGGRIMDEWDLRLSGDRAVRTWREMSDADPTIAAALFAFTSLIISAGYRLEPADETPEAEEAATFVQDCFDAMDGAWADTLSEVLTALPFGFSLLELVYVRRDDGRIGWQRWAPRAQETIIEWQWDETTWLPTAAVQWAPPSYRQVVIPIDRCLHVRIRPRKQNPMGTSILRSVYEPWYYKKHISRIEAIGIERDLAGLPVVHVPLSVYADDTQRSTWETLASSVRRDETAAILLPTAYDANGNKQYDFQLLSTGGTRQIDTDAVLARYERLILRAMLADFLTMGDTGVGSYAQSVNRTDLFINAAKSLLQSIDDAINSQAIARLCALNGIAPELEPRYVTNEIGTRDVKAFAETLAMLVTAGVVDGADSDVRQYVYDVLDLPAPTEAEAGDTTDPAGEPATDAEAQTMDLAAMAAQAAQAASESESALERLKAATSHASKSIAEYESAISRGPHTFRDASISDETLKRAAAAFDAVAGKYAGMLAAEIVEAGQ